MIGMILRFLFLFCGGTLGSAAGEKISTGEIPLPTVSSSVAASNIAARSPAGARLASCSAWR